MCRCVVTMQAVCVCSSRWTSPIRWIDRNNVPGEQLPVDIGWVTVTDYSGCINMQECRDRYDIGRWVAVDNQGIHFANVGC